MKAAVYHGVGDVRLEDVAEPPTTPGTVKLRVAYNGLCGTDLHEVYDSQRAIPASPHPLTGAQAPVVLGHEISGTVVEVGLEVDDVAVGQLVAVEPLWSCDRCQFCLSGARHLCDLLAFHGLSTGGGGLAEFTVVPRRMVHIAPEGLDARSTTMTEPLAVAWHAVDRSGARSGQFAAVLGAGPIGVAIYLTLRSRGVDAVVVEPSAWRRGVAAKLGAAVLDPAEAPVVDQLLGLNGPSGIDVCFETSASAVSLETALRSTAKRGVVMLMASPRVPLPPVLGFALARELEIRTSYAYHDDFPAVLEAVAEGMYPFDEWVETAPLTGIHAALDDMRAARKVKVLIDPAS